MIDRSFYKLSNPQLYANNRLQNPDEIIISLASVQTIEDLEITDRSLRQFNIINRKISLVIGLKKLYDNQCQMCGTKLKISSNAYYSEVHHIKPLGQPHNGPDTSSNMMVVCPNCHVQLDFKSFGLIKEKLTLKTPHEIDDKFIDYHNNHQA